MYKQKLKAKAIKMVEEGATVMHAAELIGVSRRTLHRWIESAHAGEAKRVACIIGTRRERQTYGK